MNQKHKSNKLKKITLGIAILILGLAVYVLTAFHLNTIEVEGTHYSTKQAVEKAIRKNTYNNSLYVYAKIRFKDEYKIPFVERMEVDYINRNKIRVRVFEKEIAGCLEYMNQYVYFDEEGNVLEISEDRVSNIPLISGLPYEEIQLYGKVKVKDKKVFNKILNISDLVKTYKLDIDKILYNSQKQLVLYMKDVRVYLGKKEDYDKTFAELAKILPKAKKLKGYFDLTDYEPGQDKIYFHVE